MTPEETRQGIARFYDAVVRRDGETMAALYAPNARFEDAVFRLEGPDIMRMWKGLLGRARNFEASYRILEVGSGQGTAEWTARYLFGGKHPVVNVIRSTTRWESGRIVDHRDDFDFALWASQAMGLMGKLFGRFEWFHRAVARKAAKGLALPSKY
jgi:hypothetical protein